MEHNLDEYSFDFEQAKTKNKDEIKLDKFVNKYNNKPFVPRRNRKGHRSAR